MAGAKCGEDKGVETASLITMIVKDPIWGILRESRELIVEVSFVPL